MRVEETKKSQTQISMEEAFELLDSRNEIDMLNGAVRLSRFISYEINANSKLIKGYKKNGTPRQKIVATILLKQCGID